MIGALVCTLQCNINCNKYMCVLFDLMIAHPEMLLCMCKGVSSGIIYDGKPF